MLRTGIITILTAALILLISICLLAQKLEPCEGEPIMALNDDICGVKKWIAVEDSVTICQILCLKDADPEKCGIDPSWIGGKVMFDEEAEYRFNFDPATVVIAEIVAETYQTTTCQIAENAKYYDGGTWYIPYNIIEIE